MRQFFARLLFFTLLILICFGGVRAWAQYEETEGIKFGSFSIHPSIVTGMRYVDNIYFVPTNYRPLNKGSVPQGVESDFVFNVTPTVLLRLQVPTFKAQASYELYNDDYLGYDDPQHRHTKLNAYNHTFSELIDYQAPVGVFLTLDDKYLIQRAYEETTVYVDFIQGNQRHNEGHAILGYKHGPDENFYFAGKYTNVYDQYDQFGQFNRRAWYGDGDLRIKFLPLTAFVLQGGYGQIAYPNMASKAATVFYGEGGLAGQLTSHLKIILKGGYQESDYTQFDSYKGPIGQAEFGAFWEENTQATVGYMRQVLDSSTTNFYVSDDIYLRLYHLWAERLGTEGTASYQFNKFSRPTSSNQNFLDLKIELTFRMIYWLYLGGGYQYDSIWLKSESTSNVTTRNIEFLKITAKF